MANPAPSKALKHLIDKLVFANKESASAAPAAAPAMPKAFPPAAPFAAKHPTTKPVKVSHSDLKSKPFMKA